MRNSRLYSEFKRDFSALKEDIFYYHHKISIDYDNVVQDFNNKIKVLSYFYDLGEKKYITSFEFSNYPIYGIQYHPEKSAYEWRINMTRTKESLISSWKIALAFVRECKKSNHTFDQALFPKLAIYHYKVSDFSTIYNQVYVIPYYYHRELEPFRSLDDNQPTQNFTNATPNTTILERNQKIIEKVLANRKQVQQPLNLSEIPSTKQVDLDKNSKENTRSDPQPAPRSGNPPISAI